MRIRAVVAAALLTLPGTMSAQIRPPRRGTTPEPVPLPPVAGPVARALAITQSRWSASAYSMVSMFQMPGASGSTSRFSTFGTGTHADYRYSDHLTATVDLTASFFGDPATSQTAEVGTRYSPLNWDRAIRPFFDVRAGYMRLENSYLVQNAAGIGAGQNLGEGSQYSRGFGGIVGTGADFSVTRSWAVTTEVLAIRHSMSTYKLTSTANLPNSSDFMMTSLRLAVGLRFSPIRTLSLEQKPR